MANYSPDSSQYIMPLINFRAPPPSPVAAGRRSSFANDEVLTDFLEHSLRVPDLILPDRVFPRQKSIQTPLKLDWQVLNSSGLISKLNLESIGRIGCFELVNHAIPSDLIRLATNSGAGIFKLMPEQKAKISGSNERSYGFVEFHGGEERETSEEFVWCRRDQALKLEMEGIWPDGYSNFSENMEMLMLEIEKVATGILQLLQQNAPRKSSTFDDIGTLQEDEETAGSIVYLYKHSACNEEEEMTSSSLRYDVIRMLIRGSEFPHSLCLHLCDGSSEFHVYSKKGWVSFCPDREALVITIGDRLQAWSGGEYKHVIGRPIFKSEEGEECNNTSMAFLYSPAAAPNSAIVTNTASRSRVIIKDGKNTISLVHQLILAVFFTLFYNLWSFLCPN